MITIKEAFTPQRTVSKIGALKFRSSVFQDEIMYPHTEMDKSLTLFETRPQVNSGVEQLARFIYGKGLRAVSKDKKSKDWLEEWKSKRRRFNQEVFSNMISALVAGNSYFENGFEPNTGKNLKLDNIYSINDSSRVYINLNQTPEERKTGKNYWIYEVPMTISSFPFGEETYKPRQWRINYIRGDQIFKKMIYGVGIDFSKIAMFRTGWCLPANARIETENGLMNISKIVSNKIQTNIKTFNLKTKEFEFKPIVNWFSRSYKKKIYKIHHTSGQTKSILCTDEHPILTIRGYKPANEITKNDKIAVKSTYLSKEQKSLIYGTLLGDGSLSKRTQYPRLSMTHTIKQRKYIDWLEKSLVDLEPNKVIRHRNCSLSKYTDRVFEYHQLSTKEDASILEVWNDCIDKNRKTISEGWLDNITSLSLAVWIMDDGTLCHENRGKNKKLIGVQLCTESFSKYEIELLRGMLKEKFDLNTTIQERGRIYIKAESRDNLIRLIEEYIDITNGYKNWIADDLKIDFKESVTYLPVTKIEQSKHIVKTVYDIEVKDNHNFVHNNVILHNSRDGLYGRSFLASTLDDASLMQEMLKNLAIISRNRAMNLKMIRIGTVDEPATDEDMEELEEQIKNRKEDEHIIVDKSIETSDFEHQGKYDKMEGEIDFFRKDISSGLVPTYLTPWSNEINRATSQEAKIPFQLRIDSFQEEYLEFFNQLVTENLKKDRPFLADDLHFEFIQTDLETKEDKSRYGMQLYQDGLITKNELREMFGFSRLKEGNEFKSTDRFNAPKGDFKESFTEARKILVITKENPEMIKKNVRDYLIKKGFDWDTYEGDLVFIKVNYKGVPAVKITGKSASILQKEIESALRYNGLFFAREGINLKESVDLENTDIDGLDDEDLYGELLNRFKDAKKLMNKYGIGAKISDKWSGRKRKIKGMLAKVMEQTMNKKTPSIKDVTKDLEKKAQKKDKDGEEEYSMNEFRMVARTELNTMRAVKDLLTFKDLGIKRYEFTAIIDSRTSDLCREANGKVYTIEKGLKGIGEIAPSLHPHCRSRIVPAGF